MTDLMNSSKRKAETGAILVVTLILLAAMTLASAGLFRSVDTATLLSANIGFKRDVATRTTVVAQALMTALKDTTFVENSDFGCNPSCTKAINTFNFSPVMLETGTDGIPVILLPANKATYLANFNANSWTTNSAAISEMSTAKVDVYFIIERLCDMIGSPSKEHCVYDEQQATFHAGMGDYRGAGTGRGLAGTPGTNARPLFRVTVRADGPRQTTAYLQLTATVK